MSDWIRNNITLYFKIINLIRPAYLGFLNNGSQLTQFYLHLFLQRNSCRIEYLIVSSEGTVVARKKEDEIKSKEEMYESGYHKTTILVIGPLRSQELS